MIKLLLTSDCLKRISSRLSLCSLAEETLLRDALADLGLLAVPLPDGSGWSFETLLCRAKRLVVQELMKMEGCENG